MKKAVSAKEITPSSRSEKATTDNEHFTVKIPRLKFKDGSLNVYLVFVLIIFAFILGMLTNKVLYLEKELKGADTTAATATDTSAADAAQQALPTPPQVVDVENGHLPLKGDANASVTIVEFSDFQCPFCKSYFDDTHGQIMENYVNSGKVKFAYRHFPLTSIHPNAQKAAEAAECANEQDKFWEYHDKLFEDQDTWSPQSLTEASESFASYAEGLGLNTDQFKTCLEEDKYADAVTEDLNAGDKVQVDGTPAFFVNGYRLTGAQPYSEFEKVIEEQLKK